MVVLLVAALVSQLNGDSSDLYSVAGKLDWFVTQGDEEEIYGVAQVGSVQGCLQALDVNTWILWKRAFGDDLSTLILPLV